MKMNLQSTQRDELDVGQPLQCWTWVLIMQTWKILKKDKSSNVK